MTKHPVLVVGATGMLGSAIAQELLRDGSFAVRALVRRRRPDWYGLEQIEGDITDPATLPRATQGIRSVVSAVSNQPELIIDGQANLLRAAQQAGVQRFIPSDFSVDYRKLDIGDNANLDMRIRFHEILLGSTVPYTLVLQGAFTEMLTAQGMGLWDRERSVVRHWGDPSQKMDFTTVQDTARYTVAALRDDGLANQALTVAGDSVSPAELAEATGSRLEYLGSTDELRALAEEKKRTATNPWEYLAPQYLWTMMTGKAKLAPIMNDRFPQIRPTTVREFLANAG